MRRPDEPYPGVREAGELVTIGRYRRIGTHQLDQSRGVRARDVEVQRRPSGGCLVIHATGGVVHQTAALETVLDGDPEHLRVRAEMHRVADRLASTVHRPGVPSDRRRMLSSVLPRTTLRTGRGTYIVSGSFLGGDALDPECLILVTVDRREPVTLSDVELRDRYDLTPRQVQVARLLETGRTAHEIARSLGTTLHTAERHTEHVMARLGVRSRAAVGAQLRGAVPEP